MLLLLGLNSRAVIKIAFFNKYVVFNRMKCKQQITTIFSFIFCDHKIKSTEKHNENIISLTQFSIIQKVLILLASTVVEIVPVDGDTSITVCTLLLCFMK